MNPLEFGNIAATHERLWWYRGMQSIALDQIAATLGQWKPRVIVEAGCGTGHFAAAFQARFGFPVMPWDLSLTGLEHAGRLGLSHRAAIDVRHLPVRPGAVDLLLSLDVLAHLEPGENAAACAGFASVLAPGGLLVVRCSALDVLRSRHSEFVQERQRFTRSQLRELLTRAGLRIRRLTYLNSLLFPVAWAKFRIWEPLTNAPAASGVQLPAPWLNRALELPLQIERRLVRSRIDLPIGQSLLAIAEK